jgi:hypothetical protein
MVLIISFVILKTFGNSVIGKETPLRDCLYIVQKKEILECW